MSKLSIIEGIGPAYEEKLKAAGINSIEELLEECATKKGRKELSEKTELSEKLILKWANHADLMRINGVGGEYAELLEAAGVDTIPELAQRKAKKLFKKKLEINEEKSLVKKTPSQSQVEKWVEEAGTLPRKLNY